MSIPLCRPDFRFVCRRGLTGEVCLGRLHHVIPGPGFSTLSFRTVPLINSGIYLPGFWEGCNMNIMESLENHS